MHTLYNACVDTCKSDLVAHSSVETFFDHLLLFPQEPKYRWKHTSTLTEKCIPWSDRLYHVSEVHNGSIFKVENGKAESDCSVNGEEQHSELSKLWISSVFCYVVTLMSKWWECNRSCLRFSQGGAQSNILLIWGQRKSLNQERLRNPAVRDISQV